MRLRFIALLVFLLWMLAGCGALRETTPTPQPLHLDATAEQAARAMQEDHFYSDYGRSLLEVRGKVAALRQVNGLTILTLETHLPERLECELSAQPPDLLPGDEVTLETQDASQAKRLSGAVRLAKCSLP
jgi:hypothetical protein